MRVVLLVRVTGSVARPQKLGVELVSISLHRVLATMKPALPEGVDGFG
jgi:hypothetical protein